MAISDKLVAEYADEEALGREECGERRMVGEVVGVLRKRIRGNSQAQPRFSPLHLIPAPTTIDLSFNSPRY